jgi:phosphoglycolate phosphatase
MKHVTHVIWDWNGTLLDDAWLCVEVMNDLLDRRGLPRLTPERYAEVFRFPVRDYYRDVGFDFAREPFEVVGTEFIEGYAAREAACALRPEAREVLMGLSARGYTQSVLSASQHHRLVSQAERLGVHSHFEALVGLDDHYAAGKVELGQRWLASSGVSPARAVLVGDTDHDVQVARALGVHCLLVPSGHQHPERWSDSGVRVLEGLHALLTLRSE